MKRERYDLEGSHTPWGATQSATEWAPGIVFHSTAGHGGFHLSADRMKQFRKLLPTFRTFTGGPWFEEDCDAVAVVLAFPDCFDGHAVSECMAQAKSMATATPPYSGNWAAVVRRFESKPMALFAS